MIYLRLFALFCIGAVSAFAPSKRQKVHRPEIMLEMASRRDVLINIPGILAAAAAAAATCAIPVSALDTIPADNEVLKESRQVVGKLDINNSPVTDYMMFPGMYPTIGGKISNNGPYSSVKDVYNLKLLSKAEMSKIKEYENSLTVTPATGLDPLRGRDPYRRSFNK